MNLDDKFLDEVGLSSLPENQKKAFLAQMQEELEVRVGEKMGEGLTLDQLKEFEGIMNIDQAVMQQVIDKMGDEFRQDALYDRLLEKYNTTEWNWEILGEYLSVKWIQKHRPNYREIVTETLDALKNEVRQNSAQILAA